MLQRIGSVLSGKIFFKLFALLVLAVSLPLLIFQQLVFQSVSRVEQKNYLSYKQKLNNQIVSGIDEALNAMVRQSLSLYTHWGDLSIMLSENPQQYGAEYTRALNNIADVTQSSLQSNNKIASITYFTIDGNVKLNISRSISVGNSQNSADETWFQAAVQSNGNTVLWGPHIPSYVDYRGMPERTVISLTRSIIDFNTSKPCGVLVMDQDVAEFRQTSFNVELDTNESIAILDSKNTVVYAEHRQEGAIFEEALAQIQKTQKESFRAQLGGELVLISTKQSSEYGWRVISVLPVSTLAHKSDYLYAIGKSLLGIVLLLVFGISLLCANTIVRPLSKLKRTIERIKAGDLKARVNLRGHDEIAQIGIAFNDMSETVACLITDNYETNLLKKQAELESLQSQINPHFLFNTLNSIKAASDEAGSNQVSRMIKCLSDLFRYSLNRGTYRVSIADELSIVRKYLYLQQCRFGDRFTIFWDVEDALLSEQIVRLTLQPICENAFQHGLELASGAGVLSIRGWREEKTNVLEISNTGLLISEDDMAHLNALLALNPDTERESLHERVGVINVNSRIKFNFGDEYGLRFYRDEQHTIVRLTLPGSGKDLMHSGGR